MVSMVTRPPVELTGPHPGSHMAATVETPPGPLLFKCMSIIMLALLAATAAAAAAAAAAVAVVMSTSPLLSSITKWCLALVEPDGDEWASISALFDCWGGGGGGGGGQGCGDK